MKKITLITSALIFCIIIGNAQDEIKLSNGKSLKGKIIQETTSTIVYKKKNTLFSMDKYYIDKVKYENGEVSAFEDTLKDINPNDYEKVATISVEDLKRKDGRGRLGPMKISEILLSEDEELMIIMAYRHGNKTLRIIDLNTFEKINDIDLVNYDKLFSKVIGGDICQGFFSENKKYLYTRFTGGSVNGKTKLYEVKSSIKLNIYTGENYKIKCKESPEELEKMCGDIYIAPKYYEIINPAFKNIVQHFAIPKKRYIVKLDVEDLGEQDYCGTLNIYKKK